MRVSILQDQLSKALSTVIRVLDTRSTLPVLAQVLLQTEENVRLRLTVTNLEQTISTVIGAKVDKPGAITLPARTFTELVNNLSPERVDLVLDEEAQTVKLTCGMTKTNIKGIRAEEFPPIPNSDGTVIELSGKVLKGLLASTLHAAATEDNRPILTGLNFKFVEKTITVAAADGYRLAVDRAEVFRILPTCEVNIPARALKEVYRLINEEQDIAITLPGDRDIVIFEQGSTQIMTQVLEGKFPDITAIIPKNHSTRITAYNEDMKRALTRAQIFARDSNFSVRFATCYDEGNQLEIRGVSAERGDNEGRFNIELEGDQLEAAYNSTYMIDALNALGSERVEYETNGAAYPSVLRREGSEYPVCVIMPMSITR